MESKIVTETQSKFGFSKILYSTKFTVTRIITINTNNTDKIVFKSEEVPYFIDKMPQ